MATFKVKLGEVVSAAMAPQAEKPALTRLMDLAGVAGKTKYWLAKQFKVMVGEIEAWEKARFLIIGRVEEARRAAKAKTEGDQPDPEAAKVLDQVVAATNKEIEQLLATEIELPGQRQILTVDEIKELKAHDLYLLEPFIEVPSPEAEAVEKKA
jgi:hypothetical protein